MIILILITSISVMKTRTISGMNIPNRLIDLQILYLVHTEERFMDSTQNSQNQ